MRELAVMESVRAKNHFEIGQLRPKTPRTATKTKTKHKSREKKTQNHKKMGVAQPAPHGGEGIIDAHVRQEIRR